jgi:hypothetical protein
MIDCLYYILHNISVIYYHRYMKDNDIKCQTIYIITSYLSLYLKEKINETIVPDSNIF